MSRFETKFTIDPEFSRLFPPRTAEEIRDLRKCILDDGQIYSPVIVWNSPDGPILVDGHFRSAIAEECDLELPVEYYDFTSRETARDFILETQLHRRNLTARQRAEYLEGLVQRHVGGPKADNNVGSKAKTFELARQAGVSVTTARKAVREAKSKVAATTATTPNSGGTATPQPAAPKPIATHLMTDDEIRTCLELTEADREEILCARRVRLAMDRAAGKTSSVEQPNVGAQESNVFETVLEDWRKLFPKKNKVAFRENYNALDSVEQSRFWAIVNGEK